MGMKEKRRTHDHERVLIRGIGAAVFEKLFLNLCQWHFFPIKLKFYEFVSLTCYKAYE